MPVNKALELLRELALADSFEKRPTLPDYARSIRNYSDKNSSGLQLCILDFLRFSGHQAERISVTGRYIDQSKTVTDTLGFTKRIGSGKWIKSSMQVGAGDLSAVINGKAVKIEIKIGRDKQSPAQRKYQEQVEKAGGIYLIITSFGDFLYHYNEICKS